MQAGPIFLIPLTGSRRTRELVARRAVHELTRLDPEGRSSAVVLHRSRPGEIPVEELPAGMEFRDAEEVLPAEAIQGIVDRVHQMTEQALESGGRLSPSWRGVDLGALNLVEIRRALVDMHMLARASALVMESRDMSGAPIRVLTSYPEFARSLARLLSPHQVSCWSPRRMGHVGRRLKGALDQGRSVLRGSTQPFPALAEASRTLDRFQGSHPVLFWAESVPMIQMFDAVTDEVARRPGAPPLVTVELLEAPRDLEEIGPDRWRIRVESPQSRQSHPPGHRLANEWPRAWDAELDDSIGSEYLRLIFESLYRHDFDRQAAYLDRVAAILEAVKPSLVVTGNDRFWVGQGLVELARTRGIPSLAVQDGVMVDTTPWTSAWADHVAVNGAYLGHVLRRHGAADTRWSVTGQPRYDAMFQIDRPAVRRAVRSELGVPDTASLVCFTTQSRLDEAHVRAVARALESMEGVHLALRPHPSESDATHHSIAASNPTRIHIARHQPILELIVACDVIVLESSTVALEAAALGTPVIGTAFLSDLIPPHMRAATEYHARSIEELRRMVQEVLAEKSTADTSVSTQNDLEDFLGPLDGRASERVADLILELRQGVLEPGGTHGAQTNHTTRA